MFRKQSPLVSVFIPIFREKTPRLIKPYKKYWSIMTLIFSNDNRLLFNLERSDQLLELGYNNRFNTSLDYKKLQKQANTPHKGGKKKFSVVDNNFKTILFDFIKKQDTASLALQSFSTIEILSLYGLLQNQDVLTQSFLKNYFVCVQKFLAIFAVRASLHGLQVQIDKKNLLAVTNLPPESFALLSPYGESNRRFVNRKESQRQELQNGIDTEHPARKKEIEKQNDNLSENLYLQERSRRKIAFLQDKARSAITKQSFVRATILAVTNPGGPLPLSKGLQVQSTALTDLRFVRASSANQRFARRFVTASPPVKGLVTNFGFVSHFQKDLLGPTFYNTKSASTGLCETKSALLGRKKWVETIFVSDYFVFLKDVWAFTNLQFVSALQTLIKQFLPKTRIWGFAFGSSFLLFSMTSILQRQEQNRWLLNFSRNQMPGLSLISQDSSWESFENITLNYLNRKHFAYKYPKSKGFVKKINCYKDIWYLSLSDSWNQQFSHNYTAVFSKCFEKAKLFNQPGTSGALYQIHARIPPKKMWLPLRCKQNRSTKGDCLLSSSGESNLVAAAAQTNRRFVRGSKDNFINKASVYKERVNTENDSIPSKMAASTKVKNSDFICKRSSICKAHAFPYGLQIEDMSPHWVASASAGTNQRFTRRFATIFVRTPLTNRRFVRTWSKGHLYSLEARFAPKTGIQHKENKQVKQDLGFLRERGHDRMKPLFYNFSNFSIETQAFQSNGQDTDSLYDYSFSLKKKKSDLEKLLDSNRFSFLQEKAFFKPNTDFSTQNQNEKRKAGDTLSLLEHGLEKRALYQQDKTLKKVRRDRSYQSYRNTLKVKNGQKGYKASLIKQKKSFSGICFFPYVQATPEVVPEVKSLYKQKARLCKEIDTAQIGTKSEINCYTNLKPSLSKSTEKISSYFLAKRNSISNRFMSGYQAPEIKNLQLKKERHKVFLFYKFIKLDFANKAIFSLQKLGQTSLEFVSGSRAVCLQKLYIKVPPALPFTQSKLNKTGFCLQNGSLRLHPSQVRGNPFGEKSKAGVSKKQLFTSIDGEFLPEKNGDTSGRRLVTRGEALKKIPYRHLSLNEEKEIKPLFDQVNNALRISPYHFTFKKSLFTDYNDYLSWAKDTPAAISITPSVEEEDAIKNSWVVEQSFSKKNEALHVPFSDPSLSPSTDKAVKTELEDRFVEQSQENVSLLLDLQKTNKKPKEKKENRFTLQEQSEAEGSPPENPKNLLPSAQEESLSTFEDEEKKREITKFEWLQQVREAEQLVEKRKDFQRLAYPNREALFTNRLQLRPGLIQRRLVTDRKDSFFGIANLFPKRLIAQDQKQINSQILQDEHDRRSISLLAQLRENDTDAISLLALESKNDVFIENLLKSEALYNLQKSNAHAFHASANAGTTAALQPLHVKKEKMGSTVVSNKEMLSSLRTVPRNREKSNSSICKVERCVHPDSTTFRARRHPVYAPNYRLRLRAPQLSLSSQNSNPQSRIDDLNLTQSHRWWQKRRCPSNLLGAPSKRYLVMPEITAQDWRKIIEWQLKTYFLEEEKRLAPLLLEKSDSTYPGVTGVPPLNSVESIQAKHLFKIKKIALYLPWTTLKKSLKKPFEWPLTGLSYNSVPLNSTPFSTPEIFTESESTLKTSFSPVPNKSSICRGICNPCSSPSKANFCFVSSISPNFKSSFFSVPNLTGEISLNGLRGDHLSMPNKSSYTRNPFSFIKRGFVRNQNKAKYQTSVYKPFLFEARTKSSYLVLHQLLLLVLIKQLFQSIYKLSGKVITYKIKNSSLATLLLPIFLNATSRRNQISEFSHLKKRLKDLVGSEDTVSSLSEIVWYLRNSCRGRLIPRGVVLVETLSSESTDYLKAIGGEAQVPVIVQSLRALPFTQNHPQRRLEKILTFAQKRAPCILFLDDLDSIGQSRTLLLKNNDGHLTPSKNGETSEKRKWKKGKNDVSWADPRDLVCSSKRNCKSSCKSSICTCTCKKSCKKICQGIGNLQSGVSPQNHRRTEVSNACYFSKSNRNHLRKENRQNEVVHLSDTEKIVEQRRVDLMLRLLTVMDGITDFDGVLIVTTSKNPASLDPALLRPGRFEKLISLKRLNKKKRIELLKVETAKIGHTNPMPWGYLGVQTEDMTGTEISSVVNHSAFRAIIQSTAHTFPTLEYGINCVNNNGSSALNPQLQLRQMGRKFVTSNFLTDKCHVHAHTRKKAKARADLFLKKIIVHNPYKTFLRCVQSFATPEISQRIKQKSASGQKLFTAFRDSKTNLKKLKDTSLQISFYQAGKGVVRSSIFQQSKAVFFENQSLQNKVSLNKSLNERDQHNKTRTAFAANIVRLYAGQASESLYLDSIACFKKKALSNQFSPPLFLQSTFSCNEKLHASSIIKNLVTTCPFSQKTNLGCHKRLVCTFNALQKTVLIPNKSSICKPMPNKSSICKPMPVHQIQARPLPFGPITSFPFVPITSGEKEGGLQIEDLLGHALTNLRFVTHARASSASANQKVAIRFVKRFVTAQTWATTKARTSTGAISTQKKQVVTKRLARKLQYLRCTFKKSFCIGYNSYTDLRKQFHLYRKTEPNDLALFYNRTGYGWEQKISETLKILKRLSGNWYRLYLPKLEQNKNNREWLLPDAFSNQHISLLNQNVTMPNLVPLHDFVVKKNLKASKASLNSLFSVHRKSNLSSHRKLGCSSNNLANQTSLPVQQGTHSTSPLPLRLPNKLKTCKPDTVNVRFTSASASANRRFARRFVPYLQEDLLAQIENYTDVSYYNMVLNCFYGAFQNCSENRELLDLLADHLIRFKIVRLHEVMRIKSFYF